MPSKPEFTFEISLSVLDHLGRHLYRSFATVLGEAISNAWDADAQVVHIYLDADRRGFWIKDDGIGMNAEDFQNKFLKIGYSKRKERKTSEERQRPFIGRKGIGKLALLSCADRVTVVSKTAGRKYVGGTIENRQLDRAITKDLTPSQYRLAPAKVERFAKYTKNHRRGTIIRFEGTKDGVKRSFDFLSKTIALYFRFALLDPSFKIYLDDELITHEHLDDLAERTQFLWKFGSLHDPYVEALEGRFAKDSGKHEKKTLSSRNVSGFIASVEKPQDLKIMTTDERLGVDLFVNGRLRERNILGHIPTARIVESYLYGQIHYNGLDDTKDRFTSSREGVVADDVKYQDFLVRLRAHLLRVAEDWDKWRLKHREGGDPDNPRISKRERTSRGLYNAVANEYQPPRGSPQTDRVDQWVNELSNDATFNFESYAECFVSENLVRKYIAHKKLALSKEAKDEAAKWRQKERDSKNKANISIKVRRLEGDIDYLSMDYLANLVDKPKDGLKEAALARDATEFKPMRDAVAHTALLTDTAKTRLFSVRENIKARMKKLFANGT